MKHFQMECATCGWRDTVREDFVNGGLTAAVWCDRCNNVREFIRRRSWLRDVNPVVWIAVVGLAALIVIPVVMRALR